MVTVEDAAAYVGARLSVPGNATGELVRNRAVLTALLPQAVVMVDERLGERGLARIPNQIYDLAVMRLVSALWIRANNPYGAVQAGGADSPTVFLANDSMAAVLPLLRPYLPIGAVG